MVLADNMQYFPYLLDIVVSGEYDPSFVMTHTGTNMIGT